MTLAQFIARHPRFDVVNDENLHVLVEIKVGDKIERLESSLVNISRRGVRLHVPADLKEDDHLNLQIRQTNSDLNICRKAQVQWSAQIDEGINVVGCRLASDINWEVMGELFLNDMISPEE